MGVCEFRPSLQGSLRPSEHHAGHLEGKVYHILRCWVAGPDRGDNLHNPSSSLLPRASRVFSQGSHGHFFSLNESW